jgi:hypothetical protein
MHRLFCLFPSPNRLWLCFIVGLTMLGLTVQVIGVTPALAAGGSKDPLVTIVVDETPASCIVIKTLSDPTTHKLHSMTQAKCAAGTQIGTLTVPQSQAKARREAYVMYPSMQASLNDWYQWHVQAQRLMEAKRSALQPTGHVLSASCPNAGKYAAYMSTWKVVLNDYVDAEVDFYVSPSCSNIFLDTAILHTGYVPYNNPVWWIGFDYASNHNDCNSGFPHLLYPNSNYTFYPDYTQALGYYGRFDLDSQDLCFFQGGALKYLNVGPLN